MVVAEKVKNQKQTASSIDAHSPQTTNGQVVKRKKRRRKHLFSKEEMAHREADGRRKRTRIRPEDLQHLETTIAQTYQAPKTMTTPAQQQLEQEPYEKEDPYPKAIELPEGVLPDALLSKTQAVQLPRTGPEKTAVEQVTVTESPEPDGTTELIVPTLVVEDGVLVEEEIVHPVPTESDEEVETNQTETAETKDAGLITGKSLGKVLAIVAGVLVLVIGTVVITLLVVSS